MCITHQHQAVDGAARAVDRRHSTPSPHLPLPLPLPLPAQTTQHIFSHVIESDAAAEVQSDRGRRRKMVSNSVLVVSIACAIWYVLLRQRLVPVKLMRAWFLMVNILTILPVSALTKLVVQLGRLGVPTYCVQRLCIIPLVVAFRMVWWLNPQIRVHLCFELDGSGQRLSWEGISQHHSAYVGNHASFWDVYAFIGLTPFRQLLNTRTMMKSSLRKIPIFGGVFDRVGHFPVYFKSDADGNFEVDKEKQAQVQEGIDAHIASGGNLAFFPEGAINKNPRVLQTFRYGTFHTIFKHRMETYYMVHAGAEKTWPWWTMIGGMPTDMHVRVGRFPIDYDHEDSKDVPRRMQQHMQKVYNEILAETDAKDAISAEATASCAATPTLGKQS
ncbi:acyltransferase-like protein, copy 1 [Leishmania major strain Friedlin]|uniref:Acyltransferase-like protein, copy 1 n=1 Tax=Leishmania major TaxID=5664 RepID=Q9NF91_LEIMA|nr:acyltransferase-like protein, copy 1 [Leishmania major strain Friedlin]CAC22648.1 acyltransferase-like protein, copy 1 [Leishmania major strain Friedlin]CAG9567823.1 acyltransferase-like_protein_-_copy_1 [Leishmania major strain Friedlin]|eukprot:XP_888615.1 acyltransferase-like protein, copy 1 [Leishmania major strain Friedlin]